MSNYAGQTTQVFCEPVGVLTVAKIETREAFKPNEPQQNVRLTLYSSSGVDDGAYYPAESMDIYGLPQIIKLRDLLNKAIVVAHKCSNGDPLVEAVKEVTINPPAP